MKKLLERQCVVCENGYPYQIHSEKSVKFPKKTNRLSSHRFLFARLLGVMRYMAVVSTTNGRAAQLPISRDGRRCNKKY